MESAAIQKTREMTIKHVAQAEEKGKDNRPFVALGQGGPCRQRESVTCYTYGQPGHLARVYPKLRGGYITHGGRSNGHSRDQYPQGYQ